ncbi:Aldo-keto reductase [Helicobacter heilmannii]|nr:Aldo-keto reductase [Helicobacter heilmannii]
MTPLKAYGEYNEELLGEAIQSIRNRVVLASKFGIYKEQAQGWALKTDSSPKRIRLALEGSLKRLKVECLDLYYQHRVDTNTPIEQVASTMQELIKEGKIKAWGMSEAGLESLQKAHVICPLTALQSEYSLWHREPEKEILGFCEANNIAYVAFSPLAKGFLEARWIKTPLFLKRTLEISCPNLASKT